MTTETTPAPPTPEAVAKATATYAEMTTLLNDPTIPAWDGRREGWVTRKLAADAVILAARPATAAPAPGLTPSERIAAIAESRQNVQAMKAEAEGVSPMTDALISIMRSATAPPIRR